MERHDLVSHPMAESLVLGLDLLIGGMCTGGSRLVQAWMLCWSRETRVQCSTETRLQALLLS